MWTPGPSSREQTLRGVRPAAVAGLFYPDDRSELRRTVDRFLLDAVQPAPHVPKAVIAPHAGYPYSGPIAGSAFEPFRPLAGRIERIVLLGPSHRVAFRGLALPAADVFATPLGPIEVDIAIAERLLELPQVRVDARPHAQEHALEVELPFLLQVLGPFRLVPLVVGEATDAEVAEVLRQAWGGEETRIVISSDLSHFLSYAAARELDGRTAEEIASLAGGLRSEQACGARPINGLLKIARELRMESTVLDLRNSGDTAGGRDQVVGYGAFTFATLDPATLDPATLDPATSDLEHDLTPSTQGGRHVEAG